MIDKKLALQWKFTEKYEWLRWKIFDNGAFLQIPLALPQNKTVSWVSPPRKKIVITAGQKDYKKALHRTPTSPLLFRRVIEHSWRCQGDWHKGMQNFLACSSRAGGCMNIRHTRNWNAGIIFLTKPSMTQMCLPLNDDRCWDMVRGWSLKWNGINTMLKSVQIILQAKRHPLPLKCANMQNGCWTLLLDLVFL